MKSSAIRNQRIAGAFFVGLYRLVFIDVFREVTTCHLALKYAQIGAFSGVERNKKALRNHVPDKFKGVCEMETPSGTQTMTVINEAGTYKLVFTARNKKTRFGGLICFRN